MLVLVGLALCQEPKLIQDGTRYKGELVQKFAIASGGGVEMRISGGDVQVIGEERGDIEIRERFQIIARSETSARSILEAEKAQYQQRGKIVSLQTPPNRSRHYHSDFEVRAPHQTNLKINTAGGDIDVAKIGGVLSLATSGGDIELFGIKGEIEAHTSGGDLNLSKIVGRAQIATSGGDIDIQEFAGELNGSTSGGDICIRNSQIDGQVNTSGGDIDIVELKGKNFKATTSGGDIGIDKAENDLYVRTSGGDLLIGTVTNNLEAYTAGGDIEIKAVERNLKANASGGSIRVGAIKGYAELHTSGGDVEIGQAVELKISTSGGNIVINGVLGRVEAQSSGGDIEAHKLYVKGSPSNAMALKASGGDITVYLPANLPANLNAEIIMSRHNGKSVIDSDFPIKIQREEKGARIYLYGTGAINGGGDEIRLRTSEGDIRIIKSGVSK
jgi:DUF4097 and DUF4098 domain-containing protein YvlB